MIANLIVVIFGGLLLWLWCRRDSRRSRIIEERLKKKTEDTCRAIGADVDKLMELEIAEFPPEEQARLRAKHAADRRARPPA